MRKTLTPRSTDFFTDFEEKKPTVLQSRELEHGGERCQIVSLPVKEGCGLVEDIKNVYKSGE